MGREQLAWFGLYSELMQAKSDSGPFTAIPFLAADTYSDY